ncbi:PatA/PatG family cyanobactin maturation protease [Sorangium sp. So ce233]|uniref:PatA/PatG family cyanobactin maturation protease n=1 Tax=Sorangium sp. So ce233 TaxID=3133290 RepID=UPI003F62FF62
MANLGQIRGFSGLQEDARGGDPRICVAVLDGPVDLAHPCFGGADLTVVPVLGHESTLPSDGPMGQHGTHVASILFGQKRSPVEGIAYKCRGLVIPIFSDHRPSVSQLDVTRAVEHAMEAGAHVINISGGQLAEQGDVDELLERAAHVCRGRDVLIVAAVGNNQCPCLHMPAALPPVLAVGAMDDQGYPLDFSNWGEAYAETGILAPGAEVEAAAPGGGTVKRSGTSFAAPIVSGIVALLLSQMLKAGQKPSPSAVRAALVASATACPLRPGQEPGQCLAGRINVTGTRELLKKGRLMSTTPVAESVTPSCDCETTAAAPVVAAASPAPIPPPARAAAVAPSGVTPSGVTPSGVTPSGVTPSSVATIAPISRVYALGTLGYDFGTEARRDSFKQLMPPARYGEVLVPANPYDARQLVDYLAANPSETRALIWTLNMELTPIYALEPVGPFAHDVYEVLHDLLSGTIQSETTDDYIERVSIPGILTGRTTRLFSGQVVPVVEIGNVRGLYGWKVNTLISAALKTIKRDGIDERQLRRSLEGYLNRVYYDLRNLGTTSRDRATNFAATNAFQATSTFAEAVGEGMELAGIDVEKSPVCRTDSDCWDVKLKFFDPENTLRAKRVFRFTIDVSDTIPVTLGEVRTWTTPY